jgi:hypothetical protein
MAHMFRYLLLFSPPPSIQQISSAYYMFSVTLRHLNRELLCSDGDAKVANAEEQYNEYSGI